MALAIPRREFLEMMSSISLLSSLLCGHITAVSEQDIILDIKDRQPGPQENMSAGRDQNRCPQSKPSQV